MPRLLVIDDDRHGRLLTVEILEAESYQVDSADDGKAGLALALQNHPDLILCDVLMGGLDGYGVLAALRRDPRTSTIPVIFLTGVGGPTALRKGMNLGADDYLVKPIAPALLVQAVQARLSRSAIARQEAERHVELVRADLARSLLPHELLTPLTVVMGLSSLLIDEGAVEAADVKDVARGILLGAQRLEEMITKFLVYADVQAAKPVSGQGLETDRATKVLSGAAQSKASRAGREADLEIQADGSACPMSADHLRALVEELVENALKFSKPDSRVIVRCHAEGGACLVEVADQGQGMTPEQLRGLDQQAPFLRRHQEQSGLGLGLSIVRRLVELYGGEMAFETAAGHGTTVRVRLPCTGAAIRSEPPGGY